MSKDKEDRKKDRKLGKDIFSDLRDFSTNKQWDKMDAMFSDKLLNSNDDASKCVLIVHSRYYDHWLTKRQDFIDAVLKQDWIQNDDKNKMTTIEWLEGCRHYKISENAQQFAMSLGWREMGIKGMGPEGLMENPELVEELLEKEGVNLKEEE